MNIVRRAASSGTPQVSLGWKGVNPGSIKSTFILLESVTVIPEILLEENGVISVQNDGDIYHSKDYTVKHKPNPMALRVILTSTKLEIEFLELVKYTEASLQPSEVNRHTITMLLQLIKKQHMITHEAYYRAVQQKMYDSTTIKLLLDNLTAMKHWNWMTPDPLETYLRM